MKKLIAKSLTAAMLVSMLAGCTSDKPADDADDAKLEGEVVFLTNRTDLDTDGTFDGLIAKFNEKYPDVEIVVESSTDYAGEMATRMQTTEYGDVCMIPDAVPISELGTYFEPLGTVDDLKGKYSEEYLYSKWFDGQVYGLANMAVVKGIVYNKQVFKDAGITELPKTEADFLTMLQTIKDKTEAIPYYTNANAGWTLNQWEDHAFGTMTGNADYKNNELAFDKNSFNPGGTHYELAKLISDIVTNKLCEEDPTTCDWEASKGMINRGEIATMVLGSWAIEQLKAADVNADNIGYMPYPHSVDGKQYASAGTDYCYAINKNSDNKAAARAWVDYLVDESGLAVKNGAISIFKEDPLPAGLEDFEGVTLVVDKPATTENVGKLEALEKASGVTLYDGGLRLNAVIDIARGASTDTFDNYMKSLNDAWSGNMAE